MTVSEPPLAAGAPFQTLRNYRRWVPHKDKVPRQTGNGRTHARVDDPQTWSSYALARRARGMTGLGFMLMDLPDIVVGDLDHCRDPQSGELTKWAHDLLAKVGATYVEISVSGTGLHIFGVVAPDVPTGTYVLPRGDGGQKIELYVRARRMIVVTDNIHTDAPLADLSAVARELIAEHATSRGHRKNNGAGAQQAGATPNLDGVPAEIVSLIANGAPVGADRSERLYYVIAVLREHGWSKADIIAVLRAHTRGIAARCFEQGGDDVSRQVQLCLDKVDDARAAKGAKGATSNLRTIRLEPGLYTEIAVAAEAAIGGRPPTAFRTGGTLMHPIVGHADDDGSTLTPALEPIGVDYMRHLMDRAAVFEKYDARRKKWARVKPPEDIARLILARHSETSFPRLRGVISAPSLRPDGSVLSAPGYDAATQLYLLNPPPLPPDMPVAPTHADAEAALQDLNGLLMEFPFDGAVSVGVALSAVITPVVRAALGPAPLHAFSSPLPGSGKSYLIDLCAIIANGHPCPAQSPGGNEEEFEKRLTGVLLSGFPLFSIDNVDRVLNSAALCQAVERPMVEIRPLGGSAKVQIEPRTTFFINGNNLTISGDLIRRTLLCRLDPRVEHPHLREFQQQPLKLAAGDRGRYIAAAITICRAYVLAGHPGRLSPLASFEGWSNLVRSALVWVGVADPIETITRMSSGDPKRLQACALFAAWADDLNLGQEYTARELSTATATAMREALEDVAGVKGTIDLDKLGKWLRNWRDTVVDGYWLRNAGVKTGRTRWVLDRN